MHIELVDLLRCPAPHDETWLVATIDRMVDRTITDGVLGCPICHAEYPVRGGVVYFVSEATIGPLPATPPSAEAAMRIAAALNLTEARTVALLQGRWCAHAQLVRSLSPSRMLLLNPPRDVAMDDGIAGIVSASVPLAAGSVDAVAFDEHAFPDVVESLVRALRHGGRILGPSSTEPPGDVSVLAADDRGWVGERAGPPPSVVPIGRRSRAPG